jgi:hypothetical protein
MRLKPGQRRVGIERPCRLYGTLGKDSSDSPLGAALGPQQLVKRNRLTSKPASTQVLGDRTQHRCTPDVLPLRLGDLSPEALL